MAVKIKAYSRNIRPAMPESFPRYVEEELDKIAVTISQIIQAVEALEARVAALETP